MLIEKHPATVASNQTTKPIFNNQFLKPIRKELCRFKAKNECYWSKNCSATSKSSY